MKRRTLGIAGMFGLGLLSSIGISSGVALADQLVDALSDRHKVPSLSELETIAGGHDALISRLIELRTDQTTPLVGMRSAKLLLENFQGEEAIGSAFEEDLRRDDRKGIANAIALNLDKVPSSVGRQRLAKAVLEKASHDEKYAKMARTLTTSQDEGVRELAKQTLK